jgi:hypothetical protein
MCITKNSGVTPAAMWKKTSSLYVPIAMLRYIGSVFRPDIVIIPTAGLSYVLISRIAV